MKEQRYNWWVILWKRVSTQNFSEKMLLSSQSALCLLSSFINLACFLFLAPFTASCLSAYFSSSCLKIFVLLSLLIMHNVYGLFFVKHKSTFVIDYAWKQCWHWEFLCNEEMHKIFTLRPLSTMPYRLIYICFQQLMDTCMEIYPISPCVQRTGSSGILLAWVVFLMNIPSISMDKLWSLGITEGTSLPFSLPHWKMTSWQPVALESGGWFITFT